MSTDNPADVIAQPGRPIIVCDADEVLLTFLGGLERFLPSQGLYLDLAKYALTGNIKRKSDDVALDQAGITALLKLFYSAAGQNLEAVPGAAEVLDRLSREAQIVILTNVPQEIVTGRRANLARLGMDYPVLSNAGPKGLALKRLAEAAGEQVFFIDDLAPHHADVASVWPDTHQVHFIADPRLFAMASPSPHARLFTNDWNQVESHIGQALTAGKP